jgi:hypothetical protein
MGLYFSHESRIANVAREEKSNLKIVAEEEMLYHYCQSLIKRTIPMPFLMVKNWN